MWVISLARKNDKKLIVCYENSIKKSNELSMAKLNQGLTLNQMQLLAYAIYSTQQDGKTEFIKADFEKKFGLGKYKTKYAKEDVQRLFKLDFSIEDLENDYFEYWNVFKSIKYDRGTFTFRWNEEFIPHILELKEKYVMTDLTVTSQFKSEFSWILYDYLKAHYGYWRKSMSKEALMRLFRVEDRKTYQNNTAQFKRGVLDVAIDELNNYTEFEVRYKEQKKGRRIIGFDLQWTAGERLASATKRQIKELQVVLNVIHGDMFKYINLNNKEYRQRAIDLIRDVEEMRTHITDTISITKKRADELINRANSHLRELELMLERDKDDIERDTLKYNWLNNEEMN